jgi:hypothetical protein
MLFVCVCVDEKFEELGKRKYRGKISQKFPTTFLTNILFFFAISRSLCFKAALC